MNDSTEQDPPMSLIAHLTELRDRLLRAVLAIVVGFVVLFPFANEIYGFVSAPLRALMPAGSTMIATGVASPFLTPFKLSLVLAIFLAIPVILFQIWGFIAPGMYVLAGIVLLIAVRVEPSPRPPVRQPPPRAPPHRR